MLWRWTSKQLGGSAWPNVRQVGFEHVAKGVADRKKWTEKADILKHHDKEKPTKIIPFKLAFFSNFRDLGLSNLMEKHFGHFVSSLCITRAPNEAACKTAACSHAFVEVVLSTRQALAVRCRADQAVSWLRRHLHLFNSFNIHLHLAELAVC